MEETIVIGFTVIMCLCLGIIFCGIGCKMFKIVLKTTEEKEFIGAAVFMMITAICFACGLLPLTLLLD